MAARSTTTSLIHDPYREPMAARAVSVDIFRYVDIQIDIFVGLGSGLGSKVRGRGSCVLGLVRSGVWEIWSSVLGLGV